MFSTEFEFIVQLKFQQRQVFQYFTVPPVSPLPSTLPLLEYLTVSTLLI